MKTAKTIKAVVVAAAISIFDFIAHGATINQVIVRQQWPWSTDVKVEYQLDGVDASHPVDLTVTAYNGDTLLPTENLRSAIKGDLYGITEEFGEFYIDPVAAFGSERIGMTKFKVRLAASDSASNINEVIYRVYCLTNTTYRDITKKEILNGKFGTYETDYSKFGSNFSTPWSDVVVWTAVTNDLKYMTTHLVMRKIPATNQVWHIGGGSGTYDFPQHWVKLTEEYFIGVFPITVEQHRLMTNGLNASSSPLTEADALPQGSMNMTYTRGTRTPGTSASLYSMVNHEPVFWPTNSYVHDVCGVSVLGKMRNSFHIDFDLPSDAQWEVACRAGNSGDILYNGKALSKANSEELGWITSNSGGVLHRVGLKAPNPFGLYDLYGNVAEVLPCLENPDQTDKGETADNPRVDPLSARSAGKDSATIKRGGSATMPYTLANSFSRCNWYSWSQDDSYTTIIGYRVVVPADKTTWKQ